jgi:hypothetical protein
VESVAGMPPNNRASQRPAIVIFAAVRLFFKRNRRKKEKIDAIHLNSMSI